VTIVHITGTFVGGRGMSSTASGGPHAGWTLLAAIVESTGTPYFFKLLGPADQVDAARAAFDRMIDGIAPITVP
jgi:hypothetical protein